MQPNSAPNGRAFCWLFSLSLIFITVLLAGNLAACFRYGTFAFESGEYYYNRLLSMSLAKAFQTYGVNFYDPFSRQEPIFYQFVPYWGLGWLATRLGIEPWTLANVLQLFVPPALFAVIYHLAKLLTGNRAAALAAVLLAFLFGSLEFLFTGTDRIIFHGNHAIILDLLRQLSTFYVENIGLALGYFALFCFLKAGLDERPAARRRWSAAMLLSAAAAFNVHLLVAILILATCALMLAARTIAANDVPGRWLICLGLLPAAIVYGYLLVLTDFRPPMESVLATAAAAGLLFFWLSRQKAWFLLLAASVVPVLLYCGWNLYVIHRWGGDPLFYHEKYRAKDLAIPAGVYLGAYFPMLVLAGIALWRSPPPAARWLYRAIGLAILMMVFNHAWGYNNHPYRFIPYTAPLLAILAVQGLRSLWATGARSRLARMLAIAMVCLLAVGIGKNLYSYSRYAGRLQYAIDPGVKEIAAMIETVRATRPEAVFYLYSPRIQMAQLAPYTGARFLLRSYLQTGWSEEHLMQLAQAPSAEAACDRIRRDGINVDYVVADEDGRYRVIVIRQNTFRVPGGTAR